MSETEIIEKEHKWLVKMSYELPEEWEDYVISQYYLKRDDKIAERIRETRPCYSTTVHRIHMTKEWISEGVCKESTPREINEKEFDELKKRAVGREIRKLRRVFEWEGQKFELDDFFLPLVCSILELEVEDLGADVQLPRHFKIIKEVTGDRRFSNDYIARFPLEVKKLVEQWTKELGE